jgi:hypothetical protein
MAIDSATKRASVHAYSGNDSALCGRLDGVALLNGADRSHITDRYRGIAAGAPAAVTLMAMERALFRRVFGRVFGRVN